MLTKPNTPSALRPFVLFAILSLLFLALFGLIFLTTSNSQSARQGTQITLLPPSHDTFVDPNNPATNYNATRLEVAYSNFPSFVPTRRSLLQFDLSNSPESLTTASLILTLVENNVSEGANLTVALYTTADDWAEATATWTTRPLQGTLVQTMSIAGGFTGTVTFDALAVGVYLESERTGDQVASFLLVLTGGDTAVGFGGNLLFEDREGSADGVNGNEPSITAPDPATVTPTTTSPPGNTPTGTVTPTATPLSSDTPTATATTTPMPAMTVSATPSVTVIGTAPMPSATATATIAVIGQGTPSTTPSAATMTPTVTATTTPVGTAAVQIFLPLIENN